MLHQAKKAAFGRPFLLGGVFGDENCAHTGGRGKMQCTSPKEAVCLRGVEDIAPYKASCTNTNGIGRK